jgi:tetratricopeptide (TPR) repeat protein
LAWLDLCLAVLLVTTTALVYGQVRHHDFLSYDDPQYGPRNPHVGAGLTWDGVKWAFTTSDDGNWLPLTRLSQMADAQLFGQQSGPQHLVGALLHVLSTLLLFLLLKRITGARWPAALVAFLFGLHPLHVESVAWTAERKDALSGVFWMVTLWGYVYYTRRPSWRRYLLVLLPFLLGLMSKPMIVTLPFVLLLLDVWPLGRLSIAGDGGAGPGQRQGDVTRRMPAGRVLVEKVPLVVLAAVMATVTFLTQQGAGTVAEIHQVPAGSRVANALVSYGAYVTSFVWPTRLAVFYPYQLAIARWQSLSAGAAIVVFSVFAWRQVTARPYLAVGWSWFLGTLVPVIGLVQVGEQARADRYMYIPLIGLSIVFAWGLADVARHWPKARAAVAGLAVLSCCGCAVLTWHQIRQWRNDATLFQHALDVTTDNFVAHDGLGRALRAQGRIDEGIAHFREAIRIRPLYAGSRDNLGEALLAQGRTPEAVQELTEAVRLDPNLRQARINLGAALRNVGRSTEAIAEYEEAVRRWPDYASAHAGLGLVLAEHGRPDEGVAHLREAIRLAPQYPDGHYNLARVLVTLGRMDEAATEFSAALALAPDFAEGHFNLGNLLANLGRLEDAIVEYRRAVRLKPDYVSAHCNLGSALATAGQLDEAIAHFSEALRLRPDLAEARINLDYALQARRAQARK